MTNDEWLSRIGHLVVVNIPAAGQVDAVLGDGLVAAGGAVGDLVAAVEGGADVSAAEDRLHAARRAGIGEGRGGPDREDAGRLFLNTEREVAATDGDVNVPGIGGVRHPA